MEISTRIEQDVTILFFFGKITEEEEISIVRNEISNILICEATKVLINMTNVSTISSLKIMDFLNACSLAESFNAKLKLCCLSKNIHDKLVVRKLDIVFEIYNSQKEALDSFE